MDDCLPSDRLDYALDEGAHAMTVSWVTEYRRRFPYGFAACAEHEYWLEMHIAGHSEAPLPF